LGIEPYAKLRPGLFEPPGGWGAEESGGSHETGPEATVGILRMGLTAAWPKSGSIMIPLTNPWSPGRHR